MSGPALKWANGQRIAHAGLKHLVVTLAVAVDKRGVTWRSQATLADEMAVSVRCVRYWLLALERLGIIQRAHRSNGRGGRTSDLIRLQMDRHFTITKEAAQAVLQQARGAAKSRVSKRHIVQFQEAPGADDQVSDQEVEVITQEEHSQGYQSALGGKAAKPNLQVLNGGRAA